jgi:acetylornithine deacetylase/succinyl-diaminopimelate desuccinylase-like protein
MSGIDPIVWSRVRVAVDSAVDAGMSELFEALRIPSVSNDLAAVQASASYVAGLLERDGWITEIAQFGTNPIVLAETGLANPDGPALILYGHHDVQPIDPVAAWVTPPFEPNLREGRIFCRGSADNKGQFFCHIFALRAIRRVLGDIPLRVMLVLDGQEETGSPHLPEFVESRRQRLQGALLCVTADGPTRQDERPEVVFGVRGQLRIALRLHTAGTDLHSGNWGNLVPSAGLRLAQVLVKLKGLDGRVTVPGFYDGVVAATDLEETAMREMPFDFADALRSVDAMTADGPATVAPLARLMFMPTFTVTGIECGDSEKSSIPSEAVAYIDIRLVANQDPASMFELMRAHLSIAAPDAAVEYRGGYSPSRTPFDTAVADDVLDAVRAGYESEPLRVPCSGGTLPDSVFAIKLGIPALLVPYAGRDQRNHAPNENMRLDHLHAGARTTAALLLCLADRHAPGASVAAARG